MAKLFLISIFLFLIIYNIGYAQIKLDQMYQYSDTLSSFSFLLPNWFKVINCESKPINACYCKEVLESGEFSFLFYSIDLNHSFLDYLYPDSSDILKKIVNWETYYSTLIQAYGDVQVYGHLDSVKEYEYENKKIIIAYRTSYQALHGTKDVPIEDEGPLYIVAIGQGSAMKLIIFKFNLWYQNSPIYQNLALFISRSVKYKAK